jgi:hypothetical protein
MRGSAIARGVFVLLCCVGTRAFAAADTTEVLYQTGNMGTPGQSGGTGVGAFQYLGTRFELPERRIATAVGGHFGTFGTGEQTLFAALVRLTSMSDFPDSLNPLNTPDVLATTVFAFPQPSNDVIASIGEVELTPGIYAVVFGSGQFGANGGGFAPATNVPVGIDSDFGYTSGVGPHWRDAGSAQDRFVVYGEIPEPGASVLLIALTSLVSSARRRRRSAA